MFAWARGVSGGGLRTSSYSVGWRDGAGAGGGDTVTLSSCGFLSSVF